MILGAVGLTGLVAYIFSQDFNQKEIIWREFVYKYAKLSRIIILIYYLIKQDIYYW